MNALLVLPILIPAVTAAMCLTVWRHASWQSALSLGGAAALLAAGLALLAAVLADGILVVQIGSWPAPFGISLVADPMAALMVVMAGIVGLATAIYSLADIEARHQQFGYYPLLHVLLMGICGAFMTGDIFNLYVWFEVMLIASFVLIGLGGTRPQMEGALKYVTMNLVSSAIFLAAVGVLYGAGHSLNMADLSVRLPQIRQQNPALATAVAGLFLVSFGIKAAVFPLYAWLPASYHTPPAAISAVFAGLLTKVGVYALYRVFTIVFSEATSTYELLLTLSALTMFSGVLGAVSHGEIRRILSFHIISQIGYMVAGLALLSSPDPQTRRLGLAAGIFYIAHHIIVKTNLFLIGGTIRAKYGSYELKKLGGLAKREPWLAVLFLIPALSLAGVPPFSGFWAKLGVIRAGLEAEAYVVVAVALFTGLLTLVSMMKIWNEAFWKPWPDDVEPPSPSAASGGRLGWRVTPIVGMAAITVFISLAPNVLWGVAEAAADHMLQPELFRQALGLPLIEVAPSPPIEGVTP